jgi:ribonuclease HI
VSTEVKEVTIYTDGACIGNPGPGGYGVVLLFGRHRREISGGFRLTTNNRMEIIAAIIGLKALKAKCTVKIFSDSQYLVDSMSKGWVMKWKSKGWRKAKNPDLWRQLLEACEPHEVGFYWVQGHAGDPENERCDQLSMQAAQRRDLPPDTGYEDQEATKKLQASLFDEDNDDMQQAFL